MTEILFKGGLGHSLTHQSNRKTFSLFQEKHVTINNRDYYKSVGDLLVAYHAKPLPNRTTSLGRAYSSTDLRPWGISMTGQILATSHGYRFIDIYLLNNLDDRGYYDASMESTEIVSLRDTGLSPFLESASRLWSCVVDTP